MEKIIIKSKYFNILTGPIIETLKELESGYLLHIVCLNDGNKCDLVKYTPFMLMSDFSRIDIAIFELLLENQFIEKTEKLTKYKISEKGKRFLRGE